MTNVLTSVADMYLHGRLCMLQMRVRIAQAHNPATGCCVDWSEAITLRMELCGVREALDVLGDRHD